MTGNLLAVKKQKKLLQKDYFWFQKMPGPKSTLKNFPKTYMIGTAAYKHFKETLITYKWLKYKAT